MSKVTYTLDLVELKHRVMKKRLATLKNSLSFTLRETSNISPSDIKDIEVLEEQYERMYQAILKERRYEKYEDVEKIILFHIAKLDSKLDEYVYQTRKIAYATIKCKLNFILNSKEYKEFINIAELLKEIDYVEDLLRRYSGFISVEEMKEIQELIAHTKFNCLLRAQVEQILADNRK